MIYGFTDVAKAIKAETDHLFGPLGPPAYESYKMNPPTIWPPPVIVPAGR